MNTIKLIDVYGQFDSQGSEHMFTYYGPDFDEDSDWSSRINDVRDGDFGEDVKHCYCTWCSKDGWWVAIVQKSPDDKRGGYAMLSLCIGNNRPINGEEIVKLLMNSWHFFVENKDNWNKKSAEQFLINYESDIRFIPCRVMEFVKPTIPANSAYLSYSSEEVLFKMMAYLPQSGYENYSRIFFVPQDEISGMPIECLNDKMKFRRFYRIESSDDCKVLLEIMEIEEGKTFEIEYFKPGCNSEICVLTGGACSQYAYVQGDCMFIRTAKEADVRFKRTIEVRCVDANGRQIDDFEVSNWTGHLKEFEVKGHYVTIPEKSKDQYTLMIRPANDKYEPVKKELEMDQVKNNVFTVALDSKSYNICFRLNGKTLETDCMMNPADIGNKRGEYACVVDDNKKTIQFVLQEKPLYDDNYWENRSNDEKYGHHHHHGGFWESIPNWLKYGLYALGTLIVAYLIWLILGVLNVTSKPWPFDDKSTETEYYPSPDQQTSGASQGGKGNIITDNEAKKDDKQVVDSVAWNADVNYLENHMDFWNRDVLKTAEFQTAYDALHNALVNGDVDGVIRSDSLFNGITENRKNGYYKDIIKRLKAIQKNGNQDIMSRTEDELKRISKKDETVIAIGELRGSVILLLQTDKKTQDNAQPAKQAPAQTQKGDADKKTNNGGRPDSND